MKVFETWESEIRGYCRKYPTVFATASNARQTDENGKTYIDFFAGAGVLNFGHNNERMKRAMIEFLESDGVGQSLDMYTTTKRRFIQRFAETVLVPRKMNYKMQFVGPTGTNAVEAALKLARRVTGRHGVYAFSHGFHGMTLGALACTANAYFRGAAGVPLEYVTRLPFENEPGGGIEQIRALQSALSDASGGLEKPAAVIVEPIQAEGGVNVASREWLHAVQALAHDNGALLIFDDIQAGCGRTGSYFSFDGMGLSPDIICLAKGVGGYGTPLAMNLVNPAHDGHWKPGEHTGTFRGQGLSFVAGAEAMSYIEDPEFMNDVKRKGKKIADRLKSLVPENAAPGIEVRGKGMLQGLDAADGKTAGAIAGDCFDNGLLIGPCGTEGRVLKLIPPLTTPDADLDKGLDIFEDAVRRHLKEN
jgi:diaminobutyrate-2-oxoglutarate transaminase